MFQIQKRFLKIKQKYGFRICYFKNLPTHKVGGWGRKEKWSISLMPDTRDVEKTLGTEKLL